VLAVASNTVIQLRNATNGVLITSWSTPPISLGGINTLAFSPDGTRLASGAGARASDLSLKLWNVASGNLLLSIPTAQTYSVGFVAFSPDGKLVVTAGGEYGYGPALLWRVADGSLAATFPEVAYTVAFSPDSALAIVAGTNIAIYSVATGALIRRYADDGSHYQRSVATTPDGSAFFLSEFPGNIFAVRFPLWMHVPGIAGSGLLSWSGGTGRFQLQEGTNLIDDNWHNLGGVLTNRSAVVSPPPTPARFYRVVALPN
jgi:WD40 repeat protein